MDLICALPAAPLTIMEEGDGHLVLAFPEGLASFRDQQLSFREEGIIDSATRGPGGRYYCIRGSQVFRFDVDPGDLGVDVAAQKNHAVDITSSFAGSVKDTGRLCCTSEGDIWVEGCTTVLHQDGSFSPVPTSPPNTIPVPFTLDIHGNHWSLVDGPAGRQVLVLPANSPDSWQVSWLPAGSWEFLFADSVGYVWVAGADGWRRFCPRHVERGWQTIDGDLPRTVTAVGRSPNELLMAAFASGELLELDTDADDRLVIRRLANLSAAASCIHTDRRGGIWAGTTSGLFHQAPESGAWQQTWEKKRGRLPGGGNHDIFTVPCLGKLYVAGGWAGEFGLPPTLHVVDKLFTYDPATEYWDVASSLIIPRRYNGIAEMEDCVWVIGGETRIPGWSGEGQVLYTVDIYDPASDSWRPGPSMNVARTDPFVVSCNGRIYAIGGAAHNGGPKLDSVESIGPGENAWRFETPLTEPTRQGHACALDGVIYCASIDGVFAFETAANRWDDDLPQPGSIGQGPLAAAFEGEVWVMGGYGDQSIRCYFPTNWSWRTGPDLPTEQAWAGAVVLDDRLFIVGGAHGSPRHNATVFDDRTYVLR